MASELKHDLVTIDPMTGEDGFTTLPSVRHGFAHHARHQANNVRAPTLSSSLASNSRSCLLIHPSSFAGLATGLCATTQERSITGAQRHRGSALVSSLIGGAWLAEREFRLERDYDLSALPVLKFHAATALHPRAVNEVVLHLEISFTEVESLRCCISRIASTFGPASIPSLAMSV